MKSIHIILKACYKRYNLYILRINFITPYIANMKIHEKVRWIAEIKWKNIENFFSKNKRKQIRLLLKQLEAWGISWSVDLMDHKSLHEFVNLYEREMNKKENTAFHDIRQRYSDEIDTNILYFLSLRDSSKKLIWWGIATKRWEYFTFAFKATDSDYTFEFLLKIWIWNILDYLVFNYAIQLWVRYISFWKDRNWYGSLWAKATLPMTKLSKQLLPYTFEGNNIIDFDETGICDDTLIFTELNTSWQFSQADLYISKQSVQEEIKTKYNALIKNPYIQTNIIYY